MIGVQQLQMGAQALRPLSPSSKVPKGGKSVGFTLSIDELRAATATLRKTGGDKPSRAGLPVAASPSQAARAEAAAARGRLRRSVVGGSKAVQLPVPQAATRATDKENAPACNSPAKVRTAGKAGKAGRSPRRARRELGGGLARPTQPKPPTQVLRAVPQPQRSQPWRAVAEAPSLAGGIEFFDADEDEDGDDANASAGRAAVPPPRRAVIPPRPKPPVVPVARTAAMVVAATSTPPPTVPTTPLPGTTDKGDKATHSPLKSHPQAAQDTPEAYWCAELMQYL